MDRITNLFIPLFLNPVLPSGDINGIAIFTWICITGIVVTFFLERE